MDNHEQEFKKRITERLRLANKKKWRALSKEQQEKVVNKYYEIRDEDYWDVRDVLREHAEMRRDFELLFSGVLLGMLTSILASILLKYFPGNTWQSDLITAAFFSLLLLLFIFYSHRMLAKNLDDERVLETLLEMVEQTEQNSRQ